MRYQKNKWHPKSSPPETKVFWDENKPVGTLYGPSGEVLMNVMPKRKPIGFRHPKCEDE